MNALFVVGAAAIAAVAIARRKTLKEDAERVSAVAKDGASKLNERVRGAEGADDAPPAGDDAAGDAETGADADEAAPSDAGEAATSEATEAAEAVASEGAEAAEPEDS